MVGLHDPNIMTSVLFSLKHNERHFKNRPEGVRVLFDCNSITVMIWVSVSSFGVFFLCLLWFSDILWYGGRSLFPNLHHPTAIHERQSVGRHLRPAEPSTHLPWWSCGSYSSCCYVPRRFWLLLTCVSSLFCRSWNNSTPLTCSSLGWSSGTTHLLRLYNHRWLSAITHPVRLHPLASDSYRLESKLKIKN